MVVCHFQGVGLQACLTTVIQLMTGLIKWWWVRSCRSSVLMHCIPDTLGCILLQRMYLGICTGLVGEYPWVAGFPDTFTFPFLGGMERGSFLRICRHLPPCFFLDIQRDHGWTDPWPNQGPPVWPVNPAWYLLVPGGPGGLVTGVLGDPLKLPLRLGCN